MSADLTVRASGGPGEGGGLEGSRESLAARLTVVTAALGADVWEWDPATQLGRWDASHYDLFGIPPDADFTEIWRTRVHPDDLELAQRSILETLEKGHGKVEYRYVHPERGERWIVTRAAMVTVAGAPRMVGVSLDVTEERREKVAAVTAEAHLRRVLDTLSAFVGVATPDGVLLEANRAPLEAAGLAREDVIGRRFEDAYWWSYDSAVQERLRAAINLAATGVTSRYDVPVRVAGGRLITIDFQIAPVFDADGRVTHLVPSAVDVTDRVRIAAALQESESRLRRALEAASAGTFEIDLRTSAATVSSGTNDLFGLPRDFAGTMDDYLRRVHPDDLPSVSRAIEESTARGERHEVEYRVIHADGSIRWLASRAEPVLDNGGAVIGMVGTLLDVTSRRASEERFRSTFEHAAVGLAHVGADGRFLRVNSRYQEICGYTAEELGKRTFADITHPEDLDADRGLVGELLRGERATYALEKRYVRPDGSCAWVELTASLVRDEKGQPDYFISAIQDITDRRAADEIIRQQLAEIETIYRTAPVGLGVLDAELRFRRINTRLAEINGLPAADHIGRTVRELLPDLADASEDALRAVIETGEPAIGIGITGMTPAQPGVERTWVQSWIPVLDGAGQSVGVNIVAEEVTEQRRAERLRDKFVSMLSHELRTPVTTLYAASHLLARRATGLDAELVEEVTMGSVRLHRMVENLLVLARVERGTVLLGHEPVLLHRVLPKVVDGERRLLGDHTVRLSLPADLPPVRSDADALAQVVMNLLSNAAKYGPPGGEIEIAAESDGGEVVVRVRDGGEGFGGAEAEQLFEMYYRARAASLRAPGAGIGLFVCRALIEAMGGRITARERPEGGAEFAFTLHVFREDE